MLEECLEIFKENLDGDPDMVLRGYIPKDGKYYLVTMKDEGDWEVSEIFEINFDKSEKKLVNEPLDYSYIKYLDYNSILLNTNKAISSKKIHSSTYYTFAIKEKEFSNIKEDIIKSYYKNLKYPRKYKYRNQKKSRILYEDVEAKLNPVDIKELEKIEQWILEHISDNKIFNIEKKSSDLNNKYIKIFFVYEDKEKTKKSYFREQNRYKFTNPFNSNVNNRIINDKLVGQSSNNYTLNSKKPFLKNRDRLISEPFMIDYEVAILQNTFFDYLMTLEKRGYKNIFFDLKTKEINVEEKDLSDYYIELVIYKNKKDELIIKGYNQNIKKESNIDIDIRAYVEEYIPKDANSKLIVKIEEKYKKFTNRNDLLKNLDSIFFNKKYITNRNNMNKLNIEDHELKVIIYKYGKYIEYLIKKSKYNSKKLDDFFIDCVKNSIFNYSINKAISQLNYYISLKEFFEKKEGLYMEFQKNMEKKLKSDGKIILDKDEEILFALGQVLRKIMNQSNIGDKKLSDIKEFLTTRNSDRLKDKLYILVTRYAHIISLYDNRLNYAINQILSYNFTNVNIDQKWILIGFLNESYIYAEKNNKENKKDGEENATK